MSNIGGGGEGPIESAYIEITARTEAAERGIDEVTDDLHDMDQISRLIALRIAQHFEQTGEALSNSFEEAKNATRLDLEQISNNIQRQFAEGATGAQQAIRSIPEAMERTQAEMREHLLVINQALRTSFSAGAEAAEEELDNIGGGSFLNVIASAEAASQAIAAFFGIASNQADSELREIGGADAFGPGVLSAQAAANLMGNAFENLGVRARVSIGGIAFSISSLVAGLGVFAGALATGATIATAQLEKVEIAFTGILGSETLATEMLEELYDLAATTPFEIQGLAENTAKLLASADAMGINRDEILDTLTVMGDIATILGQPIEAVDRVNRAFGQMAARGQVMTEELIQISEALPGFPVFDALAKGLGVTTDQLDEMLRKGLVPSKEAISILIDEMARFPGASGAMVAASQTLEGLFSTLKDEVRLTLVDAFVPFTDHLRTVLKDGAEIAGRAIGNIAPPVNDLASTLLDGLLFAVDAVGPGFARLITGFNGLLEVLAPVGQRLTETGAALLGNIGDILPRLGEAIVPVLDLIADLAANELPKLVAIAGEVATSLGPTLNVLSELGGFILPLVVSALDAIPAPVLAGVLVMYQFQRAINTVSTTAAKLPTVFLNMTSGISAAAAGLAVLTFAWGKYASEQAAAEAQTRATEQQVTAFTRTLSNAETATAGTRTAIEELTAANYNFSEQDDLTIGKVDELAEAIEALGLNMTQATDLALDGRDAVYDYANSLDDAGSSAVIFGRDVVAQFAENINEAAEATIAAGLASGRWTERQLEAAEATVRANGDTVSFGNTLDILIAKEGAAAAAADREAQALEQRRIEMEASREATRAFGAQIDAVLDGTGNLAVDLATLGQALFDAGAKEQQLAAVSEELGLSLAEVQTLMGVAEEATKLFAEGVAATFPSISSAISELDEITFDGLLQTFRDTYTAAVEFEANVATLAAFPNVQAQAIAAGPQVAAALAQGFRDGNIAGIQEMELLAQGTAGVQNTMIGEAGTWGINYAAQYLQTGLMTTEGFGQGLQVQQVAAERTNSAVVNIAAQKDAAWSAGYTVGSSAEGGVDSGYSPVVADVGGLTAAAISAMDAQTTNAGSSGYGVGSAMGNGIFSGLASWLDNIRAKAADAVSIATNAARQEGHIRSPSGVWREIGAQLGQGLVLGLDDETRRVATAGAGLLAAANPLGSSLNRALSAGGVGAIGAGGDTYNIDVHVVATPGMSDAEAKRQGTIQGDAIRTALDRRRMRIEAKIS